MARSRISDRTGFARITSTKSPSVRPSKSARQPESTTIFTSARSISPASGLPAGAGGTVYRDHRVPVMLENKFPKLQRVGIIVHQQHAGHQRNFTPAITSCGIC